MAETADLEALDSELTGEPVRKRWSGKKIVMIAAPVLLLLIGLGVAYAMGLFGGDEQVDAEAQATEEVIEVIFYEVPEMLVNLNTGERKSSFLKIKVALEVDRQSAVVALDEKLPRVVDSFQIYLRELRVEDLSGSAGMFRLKEELLRRVNQAVEPTVVKDVLFKEMLVQ